MVIATKSNGIVGLGVNDGGCPASANATVADVELASEQLDALTALAAERHRSTTAPRRAEPAVRLR